MVHLIDKSALVAEIERRKQKLLDHIICESDKEWAVRTAHQLNRIILYLDTIEVKKVDLEKEIQKSFIYHELHGDDFRGDRQIETAFRTGFKDGFKCKGHIIQ